MWTEHEILERQRSLERKLADPANCDDPNWINRRIARLKKLLAHKEKSREHKQAASRDQRSARPDPSARIDGHV